MKKSLLTSFTFRRALRSACVVFLALILSHYFSQTATFWLALVAVLLTQTELGFPVQRGLQRFFWLILLLFAAGQTGLWLQSHSGLPLLVILATTVAAYSYAYHSRRYLGLHFSLLALIVLLFALLMPATFLSAAYLSDIFMGAALGLIASVVIFPDQPDLEFSKRVTPLLKDLSAYLGALVALVSRTADAEQQAEQRRATVEKIWANKDQALPVWVFEPGFNPALKPGQYFFVIHLGQVTEILFALHHFARHDFPAALLADFAQPIRDSAERSQELLAQLGLLLEGKKLANSTSDFIEDLQALEENFQSKIKLSLEVLDLSRDYVYLAAFIRYLKDLRLQLLQLAATLSQV